MPYHGSMNRLDHDEARMHVGVDAAALYDLVSDVTRTPQWSPEVVDCRWLDGATGPVAGARFAARNKRHWLIWVNRPVVEVAERGKEFSITRTERGGGTMRWSYRLEPEADGTSVVLSYDVLRPVPLALHWVLRLVFGVSDLRADLNANMHTSLQRLAEVALRENA